MNGEELAKITPNNKGEVGKPAGTFADDSTKRLVRVVREQCKIDNDIDAMVLICMVLQIGGSNRGGEKSISYTYNERKLTSGQLQEICSSVKGNGTTGKLARTLASTIIRIAFNLEELGDLARQMKMDFPDMTKEEEYWCSNFQTSNPDCPERVRNWLKSNFHSTFDN